MTPPEAGTVAPYGRSCAECSRAKTKCILRGVGGPCVRCHRLNRECLPLTSKRTRSSRKNVTDSQRGLIDETANRTARLERKLDELVASIKTSGVSVHPASISQSSPSTQGGAIGTPNSGAATQFPSALDGGVCVAFGGNSISHSPFGSTLEMEFWDRIGVSPVEAEGLLKTFKTYHLRYFPFVHISAATAAELRARRPYLCLAIVSMASHSVSRQRQLGDLFRREIAEAIVVRLEKSIDLLLALLAFIGWFHNQFRAENGIPKTALSMLSQLAIAQVFDLHLNKPVTSDPQQTLGLRFHNQPDHPRRLTLEEIRAVLGCFLMTSYISSYLQKADSLRWTPHLNDCLRQLKEQPEWEGDETLVQHVQMQLVVEKTILSSWYDTSIESSGLPSLPSSLIFQTKFKELQQIRDNLPVHLRNNPIILSQYHSTELSLAEMPLWQMTGEHAQPSFIRQKYLFTCLSSAKAWLSIFRSFSVMEYLAFPFSFASHCVRCFSILLYLSLLEEPGWDKSLVRNEVDVLHMMDEWVKQLEQGISAIWMNGEESIFTKHCNFWKSIRPCVVAKLNRMDGNGMGDLAVGTEGEAGAGVVDSGGEVPVYDLIDWEFSDNEWLSSLGWLGVNGVQNEV